MTSQHVDDILNFVAFSENLGTAGQPAAEQFAAVADTGYTVVINLAMPDSSQALPNEAEIITSHGMTYVNIPVVWEHPTMRDLKQFFAVLDAHPDEKVFLHCVVNYRASAFAFLYSVLRLGVPIEEARAKMNLVWEPNDIWGHFVKSALDMYPGDDQQWPG
jgi:protein tyrosine phosphatase (PTP) superfamily phosphohydrolase (DUF442 family)